MEEKEEVEEVKPEVPVQPVQGKPAEGTLSAPEEKKEAAAEIKAVMPQLLTKEALKMVHTILGRGFIREHPEGWAILKNRLKDEVRPITEENKTLLAEVGDLEIARKTRREAYEALPKCAACKSPKGRMMYFVTPEGKIELYHSQCAGDKSLTFRYETAKFIAGQVVKEREESKNVLVGTLQGIIAVSQVESKKPAEDRQAAHKIAAEKDALKVAGRIAANSISGKNNSNQTVIGKAMVSAAIAKEKTKK